MNEIPLTQGKVTIVDASDFEWLSQWKWAALRNRPNGHFYAARTERQPNGKTRMIYMHRFILDAGEAVQVDHKDGNSLNNRRDNLRPATHMQNMQNSCLPINNTSGYKGVYWHKRTGKWMARINVNGNRKHLGLFTSLEDAARAYDTAAHELHGNFANTNFNNKQQEIKTMKYSRRQHIINAIANQIDLILDQPELIEAKNKAGFTVDVRWQDGEYVSDSDWTRVSDIHLSPDELQQAIQIASR